MPTSPENSCGVFLALVLVSLRFLLLHHLSFSEVIKSLFKNFFFSEI